MSNHRELEEALSRQKQLQAEIQEMQAVIDWLLQQSRSEPPATAIVKHAKREQRVESAWRALNLARASSKEARRAAKHSRRIFKLNEKHKAFPEVVGAAKRKENKDHDRKKEAKKAVKAAEQLLEQRTTELNHAREGALQYKRDEQIDPGSKTDDSQSGAQAAGNGDSTVDIGSPQGTAQDDNIQDDGHHGTCKPACDTEVSAEP